MFGLCGCEGVLLSQDAYQQMGIITIELQTCWGKQMEVGQGQSLELESSQGDI